MNSASYEHLRKLSRGKFSIQKFIKLKELATNTVGESNEIFLMQLNSLLSLCRQCVSEIESIEVQITKLINNINPHYMTIPGIDLLSAAVIYAEFGDLSKFNSPAQMLSFAGLEPGYYQSDTSEHGGTYGQKRIISFEIHPYESMYSIDSIQLRFCCILRQEAFRG